MQGERDQYRSYVQNLPDTPHSKCLEEKSPRKGGRVQIDRLLYKYNLIFYSYGFTESSTDYDILIT